MRRTIISTVCMAAALMFAASCDKQEDYSVAPAGTVITAVAETVGTGTKADMAFCYEVIWRKNDQIYVTDGTKDDTFTLSGGFDTNKGQFTEDGTKGISGDIEAFYPASLKTDKGYVWPAVQTNTQVAPMYARQTISGTGSETVSFSSLGAMLQIVFSTTTEGITITSITLKDESKQLSGLFTVTDGQAIMAENSDNPGVMLDLGSSGVAVGVAAKYFHLAIPAGEYNGEKLTLIFTDDVHHKECVMTSTTFPDIKRNTLGRITLAGNNFQDCKYTVKFDLNNSGMSGNFTAGPSDKEAQYDATIKEPNMPFAQNYVFRGWYKDPSGNDAWDFVNDKVTGKITLYAKWTEDLTGSQIKGHDFVKLGGYYWATENIGEVKDSYQIEKYIAKDDTYGYYYTQDNAIEVAKIWNNENDDGHLWTLPSEVQYQSLVKYCDWTWQENYQNTGMNGYLVTGKEQYFEFGNSIFLPATGYFDLGSNNVTKQGEVGVYWRMENQGILHFSTIRIFPNYISGPNCCGSAVRPVSE